MPNILKQKMQRARFLHFEQYKAAPSIPKKTIKKVPRQPCSTKYSKAKLPPRSSLTIIKKSLKNALKDYGRAICAFILSDSSKAYLPKDSEKDFNLPEFREFIEKSRIQLTGVKGYKKVLLGKRKNSPRTFLYKKLFKKMALIFIKFYALGWIYSGKVKYKIEYVNIRHKLIAMISNPEMFTNL